MEEVFQALREEFSFLPEARHIRWAVPDIGTKVRADKVCLLRVFRNFVDNALKYGGGQLSEIKIDYEESEEFHCFSVSDDGVGIKREFRENIPAVSKK